MEHCDDNCSFNAFSGLGIVISVMFGAIIAILFAFNLIPGIVTSAWIAFGLGVLSLVILIAGVFPAAVTAPNILSKCLSRNTTCFLVGIIGTIISSIAALSIVLDPAFLSVIILVAISAFFFSLMIIGLIALINCIICKFWHQH